MKFSPDGRRLATASVDGTVRVWAWDPARLREMQEPELTLSARVIGFGDRVAFSPNGLWLAAASPCEDGDKPLAAVRVWDATTGQEIHCLKGHSANVVNVAFCGQPAACFPGRA